MLDSAEKGCNIQQLKSISFSVFTTCRWNLSHTILGRSLTGFGPAAAAELFLKKKEVSYLSGIKFGIGLLKYFGQLMTITLHSDKSGQLEGRSCDVVPPIHVSLYILPSNITGFILMKFLEFMISIL